MVAIGQHWSLIPPALSGLTLKRGERGAPMRGSYDANTGTMAIALAIQQKAKPFSLIRDAFVPGTHQNDFSLTVET
jgi:hypothetical protein